MIFWTCGKNIKQHLTVSNIFINVLHFMMSSIFKCIAFKDTSDPLTRHLAITPPITDASNEGMLYTSFFFYYKV